MKGGGQEGQRPRGTGRCFAAGFEDGGRGPKPRTAGVLKKLEKARKWLEMAFLLESPEGAQPC